jgi:hypothetical protein
MVASGGKTKLRGCFIALSLSSLHLSLLSTVVYMTQKLFFARSIPIIKKDLLVGEHPYIKCSSVVQINKRMWVLSI